MNRQPLAAQRKSLFRVCRAKEAKKQPVPTQMKTRQDANCLIERIPSMETMKRCVMRTRPESRYIADDCTGCWNWDGTISPSGYGVLSRRGTTIQAHRLMYELTHGASPPVGLELDHLCRNRRCVNPSHLEAVTHRENMRRSESPPGKNARKTHCDSGHPLSGVNLFHRPDGSRGCRQCRQAVRAKVMRQEAATRRSLRKGESLACAKMLTLARRRREARITQSTVAVEMGSSPGHVQKTEKGLRNATIAFMVRYETALASLTGVPR